MKRILLDQGLAPQVAVLLRAEGWDAVHVMEANLDRADDSAILDFARQTHRACITLDHDFHAHLALTQSSGPSVVFVRLEGLGPEQQAALIRRVWQMCESAIDDGAALSVDDRSVRLRPLPLR